ncbi:MAG: DNA recombination protein RmuC, partial [Rhodobacteraceae bacterium]|nr:DNA recombination protein RmuC [Paracoccaceae bacterium]
MIDAAGLSALLDDPLVRAAAGLAVAWLLWRLWRAGRGPAPIARHLAELDGAVRALNDGQTQLHGGIVHVAEAQAAAQARMAEAMERRLDEVGRLLGDSLGQSAQRTARSLGDLQARLETIDRAQANITKLSGDVLGLQDILSNKQTRGAFGEIQLREIVTRALPPDAATFQATLSNGCRADCLIHLPHPPGPIAVDAKFPLE